MILLEVKWWIKKTYLPFTFQVTIETVACFSDHESSSTVSCFVVFKKNSLHLLIRWMLFYVIIVFISGKRRRQDPCSS